MFFFILFEGHTQDTLFHSSQMFVDVGNNRLLSIELIHEKNFHVFYDPNRLII